MILHYKLVVPNRELCFLLICKLAVNIVVYLVRRSCNYFNVAAVILLDFLFNKAYSRLLRSAASVAYAVENICPVQVIFFVFLEFI